MGPTGWLEREFSFSKQKKKRLFLFIRLRTSSRVEKQLQDAWTMVTASSGYVSQDQDLSSYRRPELSAAQLQGKRTDCCLEKAKSQKKNNGGKTIPTHSCRYDAVGTLEVTGGRGGGFSVIFGW